VKEQPVSCGQKDGKLQSLLDVVATKSITDPIGNQIPIARTLSYTHSIGKFKKYCKDLYKGFGHCPALDILTAIMTYAPIWQSFQ
jgi:hypothetical protein